MVEEMDGAFRKLVRRCCRLQEARTKVVNHLSYTDSTSVGQPFPVFMLT